MGLSPTFNASSNTTVSDYYDPHNPEASVKHLVWAPDGRYPEGYRELRRRQGLNPNATGTLSDKSLVKKQELCWACGWTEEHQIFSSYCPRVKIFHSRNNMGLWDVAGKWLLRDQPNDDSKGNDLMTYKFLRAQPGHSIPLVSQMLELSGPNDAVEITMMTRVQGFRLDAVWRKLSQAQKDGYINQMADIIKQMRTFTEPTAQKVDGTLLDDFIIGHCMAGGRAPSCTKIGATEDAWLDALEPTLRGGLTFEHQTLDPVVIEAELQKLRANFPKGGPYYLTHADLNLSNILVRDDEIVAIIDWEMAGYYPRWVERYVSFNRSSYPAEELFDPVWDLVEPELDRTAMRRDWAAVNAVKKVWGACEVNHPGEADCWIRPAFSECISAAGYVSARDCGLHPEHVIDDVQYDGEEPLTDAEIWAVLRGEVSERE